MNEVLKFILHGENIKLRAYLCPAGRWTIGIGNTFYEDGSPVKKGDTITEERAYRLAETVIVEVSSHIKRCLNHPVNKNQFTALISFCYNIGKAAFENSKLLALINSGGSPRDVKALFMQSFITAKGKPCAGLVNRRLSEVNRYFTV
jgi:lysozyme